MSEDENELKSDLPEENEPDNEKGKIPFTKDSWILGSKYKTRYKRIALTFWTAVVGAVIYFGLRSNLQNIVESYLELGLLKTIPIFWSGTAQWLLGLEVLGFMVAGGVLMSMSWWRKEPEAPPPPTVITWLIFILGTIALIIGEALGAVGTAGWTLFFWILFSILGFIYFVLWLFQPWFEYWRHLYCRWVFYGNQTARNGWRSGDGNAKNGKKENQKSVKSGMINELKYAPRLRQQENKDAIAGDQPQLKVVHPGIGH